MVGDEENSKGVQRRGIPCLLPIHEDDQGVRRMMKRLAYLILVGGCGSAEPPATSAEPSAMSAEPSATSAEPSATSAQQTPMRPNMTGAYGPWLADQVLGPSPGRLSLRSGQYGQLDSWRAAAR